MKASIPITNTQSIILEPSPVQIIGDPDSEEEYIPLWGEEVFEDDDESDIDEVISEHDFEEFWMDCPSVVWEAHVFLL